LPYTRLSRSVRLAPRGTGLNLFNHSGTQVDGIGLRHRSLQKTNQCRQTRSSTKPWESFRFEPSEICYKSAHLVPCALIDEMTSRHRAHRMQVLVCETASS